MLPRLLLFVVATLGCSVSHSQTSADQYDWGDSQRQKLYQGSAAADIHGQPVTEKPKKQSQVEALLQEWRKGKPGTVGAATGMQCDLLKGQCPAAPKPATAK
jgi:hypothetical protein